MSEIKMTVCKYPDRANLVLRYIDPISGKQKTKSAGTADEATAIGKAAVWQDELNTGRYQAPSRLTWAEFRKRYEEEKLSTLAERTKVVTRTSLNHLERVLNPDKLAKLTTATLSRFQSSLRDGGMGDTTLAKTLRHIHAALSWGVSMGLLAKMPEMHGPRRVKGQALMRGRAITEEEFDRMVAAVVKVRPLDAPAWQRLLRGLWLSGLRLGEALALSWDLEAPFQADLTGRRPSFRIYGKAQKSGRDEVLPMTPDFAQFLIDTPEARRSGYVFKMALERGSNPIGVGKAGAKIAAIGKKAGVVVNKADGKFASAHDLRRAFGTRWAKRVMPAVLKRLMRHSSIGTTMAYYVDMDAAEVADQLWKGWGQEGNNQGNMPQETETPTSAASVTTSCPNER
jgi:integrase